jgi:hypothetical protein
MTSVQDGRTTYVKCVLWMYLYIVFVVVPVLITTGVTSRGEKGLRIRRRQSLRFLDVLLVIVKTKVTPTKQKAFYRLELAGCVGC